MLGKPSRHLKKHLEENGKRANATVVEIASRGMAVTNGAEGVIGNTTLALKTKLHVEPNGEPAFEIEKRFRYGQLAVPSAGMKVAVLYDPADHDKIMLDDTRSPYSVTDSGAPVGSHDLGELLADVKAAQAQSGGDPQALAKILREKLGAEQGIVIDGGTTFGMAAADPLDRLEKLAKLHREGVLTDAEFAEQKQKILADGL